MYEEPEVWQRDNGVIEIDPSRMTPGRDYGPVRMGGIGCHILLETRPFLWFWKRRVIQLIPCYDPALLKERGCHEPAQ